jgi:fluoride ion exporter CrcB/FEX
MLMMFVMAMLDIEFHMVRSFLCCSRVPANVARALVFCVRLWEVLGREFSTQTCIINLMGSFLLHSAVCTRVVNIAKLMAPCGVGNKH